MSRTTASGRRCTTRIDGPLRLAGFVDVVACWFGHPSAPLANPFRRQPYMVASPQPVSPGKATISLAFVYDGGGRGRAASAR